MLAEGREGVDVDLLARMSSHLRRIAESIGLDRVHSQRVPSLSELMESRGEP